MRIRELIVRLGIEADMAAVAVAEQKMEDLKSAAGELGAVLKRMAIGFAAVGAAAAANAIEVGTFAEEVERSANAFGMSVEKYQEMRFAFQSLGASSDDLADALSTMAERVVKASSGSKEARQEFEKLGLNVKELRALKPHDILEKWMAAASKTKDINASIASGVALLGDDLGRRVAKGLRTAGNGYTDYIKIMQRIGPFSKKQLEDGIAFQKQMRLLGATFTKIRRQIGFAVMPAFRKLADFALRFVSERADDIRTGIEKLSLVSQRVAQNMVYWFTRIDQEVRQRFGSWPELFSQIGNAMATGFALLLGGKVAMVVRAVSLAFSAFSVAAAVAVAKVVAISAAVALFLALFESLYVWIQDGNSVVGDFFERIKNKGGVVGWLAEQIFALKEEFGSMLTEVRKFWDKHGPNILAVLKKIGAFLVGTLIVAVIEFGRAIVGVARLAIRWFDFLLEEIKPVIEAIGKLIEMGKSSGLFKGLLMGDSSIVQSVNAASAPIPLGSAAQREKAGASAGTKNVNSTSNANATFGDIVINGANTDNAPALGRQVAKDVGSAFGNWANSWGNALTPREL